MRVERSAPRFQPQDLVSRFHLSPTFGTTASLACFQGFASHTRFTVRHTWPSKSTWKLRTHSITSNGKKSYMGVHPLSQDPNQAVPDPRFLEMASSEEGGSRATDECLYSDLGGNLFGEHARLVQLLDRHLGLSPQVLWTGPLAVNISLNTRPFDTRV